MVRVLALSALFASLTQAQSASSIVRIVDDRGNHVPFAVVTIANGNSQVASDSGIVRARMKAQDSLRVEVRRIGYRPFNGWASRGADSTYVVTLPVAALALAQVTVTERASTPLARTGFYDRVNRVQRGAIVGEFITPEELDARNQAMLSNILQGRRHARVSAVRAGDQLRRLSVILGRGGCRMTIIVDGQVAHNTAQDLVTEQAPQSITAQPAGAAERREGPAKLDLDELVDGRSVMAVEIYPSTANAPAELVPVSGRGSCGIVAIWTGPRQ